jgi:hypothetical protein
MYNININVLCVDDTNYWWNEMPEPKHFMMIPNAEHSLATGILEAVPAIGAWIDALLHKDTVPKFTWEINNSTGDITVTLDETGIVHSATMWYASSCGENAWDNNTKRRDFRIAHLDNPCTCGPFVAGMCVNLKTFWKKQELEMQMVKGKRTYVAHQEMPTDGTWTAFLVDIKYVNKHAGPFDWEGAKKSITRKNEDKNTVAAKLREVFPDFGGIPHDFGQFFEFTSQVSIIPNTFPYPDCSGASCGETLV